MITAAGRTLLLMFAIPFVIAQSVKSVFIIPCLQLHFEVGPGERWRWWCKLSTNPSLKAPPPYRVSTKVHNLVKKRNKEKTCFLFST